VVLLTNRVHPTRENTKIQQVRPALHDAVLQRWGLRRRRRPRSETVLSDQFSVLSQRREIRKGVANGGSVREVSLYTLIVRFGCDKCARTTGVALQACSTSCLSLRLPDGWAASGDFADDASLSASVPSPINLINPHPREVSITVSLATPSSLTNRGTSDGRHVLETFRDGGQPYILVSRPNSPPRLLQAAIVAVDSEHDVAILLATPNPFAGNHKVAFLPLAPDPAFRGQSVIALFASSSKAPECSYFRSPQGGRSSGEVLSYESRSLKNPPPRPMSSSSASRNAWPEWLPSFSPSTHAP